MGDILGSGMEALGMVAPGGVGSESAAQARSIQERAIRELEKLDIPPMEAQRLVLERPELVAQLVPQLLDESAMGDIEVSPGFKQAQLEALEGTQELAESGGFTPDTLARFEALRRQSEGDEASRQGSIMQSMAERGQTGEGAELATRLASSQAATQRGADVSRDMLMQAPGARLQALQQAGQMGGQLRGQEYGEKAQAAQAKDVINQFNVGLQNQAQQYNVGEKQRLAEERARLGREEERQRAGLYGQKFQQEMQKATGVAGQLGGLAQSYQTQSAAEAQAAQQRAAGVSDATVGVAKAFFGGKMGMTGADGGVKRDEYADGGVERGMNYEAGGMGGIIESGTEDFVGDDLNDRINDGEMVLNLDSQDILKNALAASNRMSRGDEQVASGVAQVNPDAQDELMAVARGQIAPEQMSDKPVVENRKSKVEVLNELLDQLSRK